MPGDKINLTMHMLSFYRSAIRRWFLAACVLAGVFGMHVAQAAMLSKAQLQEQFGETYLVGEKLTALPVWPVFHRSQVSRVRNELYAYAFETIDIEPVAGYGGKPINILVVMTPTGNFLAVRLLKQHEPIFQSPAANALLADFAQQYVDLTVQHSIQVLTPKAQRIVDDQRATLHGVTAGTVSATAMDRTIMEAAAQVAYAKLDDPSAKKEVILPRGGDDHYERMGWNQLVAAKLIQPISISNKEIEKRFADTTVAGLDAEGMIRPGNLAVDMWVSLAGLPQVGRNLFDSPGWQEIRALRESGIDLIAVIDNSRYPTASSSANGSGRMARLIAHQGEQPPRFEGAAFCAQFTHYGQHSGVGSGAVLRLFATGQNAKLNLMLPVVFDLNLSRASAEAGQTRVEKLWNHSMTIPNVTTWQPTRETPTWWRIWEQRKVDLLILIVGLIVLSVALANQLWVSATQKRLAVFRMSYLVFTLGL